MQQFIPVLQANTIGILLMLITLFSLTKSLRSRVLADKLFFWLAFSVMVVCFMEILSTLFEGQTFAGASMLNRTLNAILFAVNPIPAFLWAAFANCKIYDGADNLKKNYKRMLVPLIIVLIASFANLFTDVFFSISEDNFYVRTEYFIVATLLSVLYMLYVLIVVIANYRSADREMYVPLLSFMILPIIGLTLQSCFQGLYMLWVSVSISIIIIYNYVQNDASITDWLTGLYNRKHLDNYLRQTCKRKRDNLLVGLLMDIDCFKTINDTYGHLVGDAALKETAAILKRSVDNKAYISRYAGDEFVVIVELADEEEIKKTTDKIHREIDRFNKMKKTPYQLSLSIGVAVFDSENEQSTDDFLGNMDKEMYLVKKAKRRANCENQ